MKKKIIIILIIIGLIILFLMPYLLIKINLNGQKYIELNYGDNYIEKGASAKFLNEKLNIKISGSINTKKLGKQKIIYEVKNKLGVIKKKERIINVVDKIPPMITLNGAKEIDITVGDKYMDPGYKMIDNVDGDISIKVSIKNNINVNKIGTYNIIYEGKDSSNNKATIKRIVNVIDKEIEYQNEYDKIDNKLRTWWSGNKKNNKRPITGAGNTIEELKKYNAYYIGEDKKIIYLTFDEGSNDTYLKEIVDVLNENDIKATFFLCNGYMVENADLVRAMVDKGHSIGNHTVKHKTMPNLANKANFSEFIYQIRGFENNYYKITGKKLDKIYREPKGEYSYRTLTIVKDMGYKTFFWSADHYDFAGNVSKDETLNRLMTRYHNGAIYMLHPKNKGNYEALDHFIKNMKTLGYEFGLVRDINY